MIEEWAQIEGFPDYAISNLGRVMSLRYDRELTPRPNSYGYNRIVLYRDRERYDLYIHHLVAAAFTTGYTPGTRVKHIQDNSDDNVRNLKFARGVRVGQLVRNPPAPIARHVQIVETGEVFRTVEDCASYLGGDPSSIYRVLRGERRSHKGYTFGYLELVDA